MHKGDSMSKKQPLSVRASRLGAKQHQDLVHGHPSVGAHQDKRRKQLRREGNNFTKRVGQD